MSAILLYFSGYFLIWENKSGVSANVFFLFFESMDENDYNLTVEFNGEFCVVNGYCLLIVDWLSKTLQFSFDWYMLPDPAFIVWFLCDELKFWSWYMSLRFLETIDELNFYLKSSIFVLTNEPLSLCLKFSYHTCSGILL